MKLIALDLDGTLLNSEKVISAGNFAALSLAAEQGHVIVPATGRALRAIPDAECSLELINGLSPIVMNPCDGSERYSYMVLPVRLKAGE